MPPENRAKPFEAVYLPVGVPTFHLESAQKQFEASGALLHELCDAVAVPDEMVLSLDALRRFLRGRTPDLVTFANAAYVAEVLAVCPCPIVLWTLREPAVPLRAQGLFGNKGFLAGALPHSALFAGTLWRGLPQGKSAGHRGHVRRCHRSVRPHDRQFRYDPCPQPCNPVWADVPRRADPPKADAGLLRV